MGMGFLVLIPIILVGIKCKWEPLSINKNVVR